MGVDYSQRPPTATRAWWYHPNTTWHARKLAVDAWNRANRPVETTRPTTGPIDTPKGAGPVSKWERVAAVESCFEAGLTAAQVVDEMGVKAATIVRALERAGRRDLIPEFDRLRRVDEKRRSA